MGAENPSSRFRPTHITTIDASPTSPAPEAEVIKIIPIPEFTGPMAAIAISFFQDRSHQARFKELEIPPMDEDFVDKAYNLASENLTPEVNRAELRYSAVKSMNTLTQISQERLDAWLLEQPEEAREVIRGLIEHTSGIKNKKGVLDELVRLAHTDKMKPANQR